MSTAAFYCVSDARYFLGAVALLNSLRLQGHREPVFVLDCGLERRQRDLLSEQTTVVPNRPGTAPWLAKTIAPTTHPARVSVLVDADMIVTRPLGELIDRASEGRVVAFENDRPRFVPEWGELLDLGHATPRPYVTSGLVILGGEIGAETLALLDDRQHRVDLDRSLFGSGQTDYPFLYPEQDVLNAILCTRVKPSCVDVLDHRLVPNPPFSGVRLRDPLRLRCEYDDGVAPYVLHHFHRKPWIDPMFHGLFSRLLTRLLLSDDVTLRVPDELVPMRLRHGPRARLARAKADVVDVLRRRVFRLDPGASR